MSYSIVKVHSNKIRFRKDMELALRISREKTEPTEVKYYSRGCGIFMFNADSTRASIMRSLRQIYEECGLDTFIEAEEERKKQKKEEMEDKQNGDDKGSEGCDWYSECEVQVRQCDTSDGSGEIDEGQEHNRQGSLQRMEEHTQVG